jgi:uncharacterized protein
MEQTQSLTSPAMKPGKHLPVPEAHENRLFPVFLKLHDKRLLLLGGGKVALEKLQVLLKQAPGTRVHIVAPEVIPEIVELAERFPELSLTRRAFHPDDLEGADLLISAINNREESAGIRQLAHQRRILVNVADTPDLCDFYLGAVLNRGHIKIAISTNGKSPTLAKRLRDYFGDILPDEISELAQALNEKRNELKGDFEEKVRRMNELTRPIAVQRSRKPNWKRIAMLSVRAFAFMLVGHFILSYIPFQITLDTITGWISSMESMLVWVFLAGFLAQLIDGALGMGYGVTSTTILLSAGVNIPAISASVHTAEIFASGASGYSHYKFGNVNRKLFRILVIPGVIGAILGAVLLVYLGESHLGWLRPIMALYTGILGVRILFLAFRVPGRQTKKFRKFRLLAWAGGFLDSFGGGGWGPIVTSTLITSGRNPRYVIGSVSVTEFFVTMASAFTFFTILGITHWKIIVALITGGLLAAPFAAKLAGKLPRKISFILLGVLVLIWSIRIILQSI